MTTVNPGRSGQIAGSGDARALFLKVFSGEVLLSYQTACITAGRVRTRTIASGKSAQFPTMSQITAGYHTPGTFMDGKKLNGADDTITPFTHNERIINIDQMLVAHAWINNIDELFNHYDVRGPYAAELGSALARADDVRVLSAILRAARTTGQFSQTGGNTGAYDGAGVANAAGTDNANLRPANVDTDAKVLANALIECKKGFAIRNVGDKAFSAALRPAQYYLLLNLPSTSFGPLAVNKDWGGEGSFAKGQVARIADIELLMTNQLPSTDVTTQGASVTGGESYNGNFTNTVAAVWADEAVGTVQLAGIQSEMEYSAPRQATFMASKFVKGTGVLRPQCAAEIATAAVADAGVLPA